MKAKNISLIVSVCMDCKETLACQLDGTVVIEKNECNDCDQIECSIKVNTNLFDVSHGLCDSCLDRRTIYMKGGNS